MIKQTALQNMSLRAKFKTSDVVEVTIIDHATCTLYTALIEFRSTRKPKVKRSKTEEPVDAEEENDD